MGKINIQRYYYERSMIVMQYVILDGNIWINYDWLSEELNHTENYINSYYRNRIDESNKKIIKVVDENDYGYEYEYEQKFISRFAAHELINRHIDRLNDVKNCLIDLESSLGMLEENHDLKIDIELMVSEARSSNEDFNELAKRVEEVYKSPIIQEIVKTKDIDDKDYEFEKILDDLRKVNKNERVVEIKVETETKTGLKYKKINNPSEPPEWLKELL